MSQYAPQSCGLCLSMLLRAVACVSVCSSELWLVSQYAPQSCGLCLSMLLRAVACVSVFSVTTTEEYYKAGRKVHIFSKKSKKNEMCR